MIEYFRTTILPSKVAQLLIQSGIKWDKDNCPGMAASLSYFSLFSLFPMLLVALSVLGHLLGPGTDAFQSVIRSMSRFLPPEAQQLVKDTLISLNQNSVGAGIIGSVVLIWTASAVFSILRSSMNHIWRSPSRVTETGSVSKMVLFMVMNKLFSFLLVFGTAFVLLSSLVMRIVVRAILGIVNGLQRWFPWIEMNHLQLSEGLQIGTSFFILSITICLLFKILPTVSVAWGDVWLGALITAAVLVGLQHLASSSVISIGGHFVSYGVIGSVMILMMWIFLTFQIFLFGAVFTYVYAHLFGSRRNQPIESGSMDVP
ncbi:MAG TPA: YihY/virulence factor BrkB family protein [Synechococcales cyanobacterium M55_K2018_004]|nr:YihY/virulence factor BrkB family protein [Synechococcales cyanobacterium M55_K2018_004]